MNGIQKKFVLDALDSEEKLTDWELDFINSLAEMPEDRNLTSKQNAILNRISQTINR